jgi:outer membrane usher protein
METQGRTTALARCSATLLLTVAAVCPLDAARTASDGRAIVPITVNTVDKGAAASIIEADDVFVAVSDLEHAGLRSFSGRRRTVDGLDYVSLKSLAPGLAFQLDKTNLTLHLDVQPDLLANRESVDLSSPKPAGMVYSTNSSAFVNYSVSTTDSGKLSGFLESGWSLNGNLLYASGSRNAEGEVVRGMTNLTVDDRARMVRWVVGDSMATAGPLGSGLFLAGVSVSRNFGLDPYFYRLPSMGISGTVATPSWADVYVNGSLVREVQLAPGAFELKDIGLHTGAGETRVVLRDPFGKERIISSPYYLSASLLAPGLSEYSYNLGFRREEMATKSYRYGDPVFVGYHRIGLSNSVTAGLSAEATKGIANAGAALAIGLGFGQMELAGAESRAGGTAGWAASASVATISRSFSLGGFWRARSDRYAAVTLASDTDRAIQEIGAGFTVGLGRLGTVAMQYSREEYRDVGLTSRYGASISSPVGRNLNLFVSADRKRTLTGWSGIEGSIRISYFLGGLSTASVAASHSDRGTRESFDAHKSIGPGTGLGYRLQGETGGASNQMMAIGEGQGPYGRYEARYTRYGDAGSGYATVSGGLVALGGVVMASRPVRDAFALLRVPGIEGLTGSVSNQAIGKTNRNGDLLLPELLPYYGNIVDIDQNAIPADVELGSGRKIVAPPYRGGALIELTAKKTLAFRGSVKLAFRGQDVIPAYGAITVKAGGSVFETSIGRAGDYYVENVPPGEHTAEIVYMGTICTTAIRFPQTAEPLSRIPLVVCAIDAAAPGGAPSTGAPAAVSAPPKVAPLEAKPQVAPPSGTRLWGIQIAAHADRTRAEAEAKSLAAMLGTTAITVPVTIGPQEMLYRVVVGRFATADEAQAFWATLDAKVTGGAGLILQVDEALATFRVSGQPQETAPGRAPAAGPEQTPKTTTGQARERWGVQVASYLDRVQAEANAAAFASMFGTKGTVVAANLGEQGTWYRVILGEFSTKVEAREFRARIDARIPGGAGSIIRVGARK